MKTCSKCGVEKPLDYFHRQTSHPSGFRAWCKECRRDECRAYWQKIRKEPFRPEQEITEKRCTVCKLVKPVSEFYLRSPGRYRVACKMCGNALSIQWQKKNPEKAKAIDRRTRQKFSAQISNKNKVRNEKWNAAHPGASAARARKWYRENVARAHASTKRLKMQRRNAVPKWADLDAIRSFYEEARRKTLETGIPHHVDHVIPLTHPLVCGLHVEQNMQVIPWIDNIKKANKFVPGESDA